MSVFGRSIVLLGIHVVLGHFGHHHHDVVSKSAKAHAALLHVVQRTERLVNGTEAEMSRCASALTSAQGELKQVRNQMKELTSGIKANDASINETARLEAILSSELNAAEAQVAHQSAKAEKLENSVTSFAHRIEDDQAELARRKKSLFDRIAKLRLQREELQHSQKESEITRLALQRMHNWKHISQERLRWEEEKLESEKQTDTRLRQAIAVETGEVKKELLEIEKKVMTWDTKRFLLADLLGHIQSAKQAIANKKYTANEDKARLQDLGHLLEHRAQERVEQEAQLKHVQEEYHNTLEKVVKAQEEQLSEDKTAISTARKQIKKLRAGETANANSLRVARLANENLQAEWDIAQQSATEHEAQVVESQRRNAELIRRRDEMLERLTLQREKELAVKDKEISQLVSRLNEESAQRDAEVAKLQGSLNSLRPAYDSRGDAVKMYEDIMVEQNHELKSLQNAHQSIRKAYHSTQADLEKCLTSANHVDSTEAKEVLEAVQGTMAGAAGETEGPLAEIAGAIKDAVTQALGPQLGKGQEPVPVVDTTQDTSQETSAVSETFKNLKKVLGAGAAAATGAQTTAESESYPPVPSHWDNEPEVLAADFEKLMSKLRRAPDAKVSTKADAAPKPLEDTLAASWENAATARKIHKKSVQLPGSLGEKVRSLATELHDVHFGMAGLAGALDEISNL